jgi:hypothetical protein
VLKKIYPYIIGFIVGVITLWAISSGAKSKLISELNAAKWTLESASRTIADLTNGIQSVSIKLKEANKLIDDKQSILIGQQSIIRNQQSTINNQKSIIEQISVSISGAGDDIGRKIQAFADGYRQLYNLYH